MKLTGEDVEVTNMTDDPVFLGVYIDCECGSDDCDGYKSCDKCKTNQRMTKEQLIEYRNVYARLNDSIAWVDTQIDGMKRTFDNSRDNDRYVNFEWLKSHLLSIRNDENRGELK